MTIDQMLERFLREELNRLGPEGRRNLSEHMGVFDELVEKGLIELDGYGAAPISTMPLGIYNFK